MLARKIFHLSRYLLDNVYSSLCHSDAKAKEIIFSHVSKKNLCLFSHFDPHQIIDDYVIFYLQELAKYCDIVLITTCNSLDESKIKTICKKIIYKKNRGLDFGSYKCGLEYEKDLHRYEKLILANDSVYGPLFDLQNTIEYGDNEQLAMWGATDSYMIKYHIQSYFVVFNASLFLHPAFKLFWNQVNYLGVKNNIIRRYEIGMSQYFLNHGFKLGAPVKSPPNDWRVKFDPTHHAWDTIILNQGYPFIKRMLIRQNPHRIEKSHWKKVIRDASTFDIGLIEKHLERTRN